MMRNTTATVTTIPGAGDAVCEEVGLTAERLPARLRQAAGGTPLQPTQIKVGVEKGKVEVPMTLLARTEPARGWEGVLAANRDQVLAYFTGRAGQFLAGATPASPLAARLAALEAALGREAATLREGTKRLRADYARTCVELRQQQAAWGATRRGLFETLFSVAFDAARATQLWNTRENLALHLDSSEAALSLLLHCAAQLAEAGTNVQQVREWAAATAGALGTELTNRRQQLAEVGSYVPDLALDHARIAAWLAEQEPPERQALDWMFNPPADAAALGAALHAAAQEDATAAVARLGLAAALEAQRQAERLADDVNGLLLLGAAVLKDGCLRRGWTPAGRPSGQRVIVQMTDDGRPLFQAQLERGTLCSAAGGLVGQVGFLELVDEIAPDDLAVVRQARAALDGDQVRQNNVLLPELLPPSASLEVPLLVVTAPPVLNGHAAPATAPLAQNED